VVPGESMVPLLWMWSRLSKPRSTGEFYAASLAIPHPENYRAGVTLARASGAGQVA